MTFSMIWPIALIVVSNVLYNICSKSTPNTVDPLASLTITYAIGTIASGVMFFLLNKNGNLIAEYKNLSWSSFAFGISIVGLEVGSIYMYKSGWAISSGQLVHSSILAIFLLFIGVLFYHEQISFTKIVGILICIFGIYLINK